MSKKTDTRKRLLDTARREFAKTGYDGVSVNAIVRLAGVSKGAFYWYFKSKKQLFMILMDEELDSLRELKTYMKNKNMSPSAALAQMGVHWLERMYNNRETLLLIFDVRLGALRNEPEMLELHDETMEILCRELAEILGLQDFSELPFHEVYSYLIIFLEGLLFNSVNFTLQQAVQFWMENIQLLEKIGIMEDA